MLENLKRHEVSVLAFGTPEQEQRLRDAYGNVLKHIVFVNNNRPRIINLFLRIWLLLTGRSSFKRFYSRKMQAAIDRIVRAEHFDLIHCCTTILGYHRLPSNIPLVGDTHNVEHDAVYRAYLQTKNLLKPYYFLEYTRLKREELACCEPFNVMVTTTKSDFDKFRALLPDKPMHVVSNGVDPAFFEDQKIEEEPNTMVFTGLMSYYPNNHGILFFLDEIFPLIVNEVPDAKLYVVGAAPPLKVQRRAASNIVVTGFVPDVRPYFARSQVFVIPLKIGGGIRGKALEAMAMRRPIVTTTLGCEGINLKHEDSALFADSPKDFAAAVVRLFRTPELRSRLTAKAHENVVKGYSWDVNGLQLEKVYQSLLNSKSPAMSADANRTTATV